MKKFILFCFACLMLLTACNSNNNKNTDTNKYPNLTGLDGISYSFTTISPDVVEYLKTSEDYSKFYTKDKKFVIYFIANCPYAQMMINAMIPLRNDADMRSKYGFYPQDAMMYKIFKSVNEQQAYLSFSKSCKEFCIVNPLKNQIFAIDGIGKNEADKVSSIMEQLKEW